jgi:hypothetical protein
MLTRFILLTFERISREIGISVKRYLAIWSVGGHFKIIVGVELKSVKCLFTNIGFFDDFDLVDGGIAEICCQHVGRRTGGDR